MRLLGWIKKETLRRLALEDPMLEPLWNRIWGSKIANVVEPSVCDERSNIIHHRDPMADLQMRWRAFLRSSKAPAPRAAKAHVLGSGTGAP
jgi:hypothetical protein